MYCASIVVLGKFRPCLSTFAAHNKYLHMMKNTQFNFSFPILGLLFFWFFGVSAQVQYTETWDNAGAGLAGWTNAGTGGDFFRFADLSDCDGNGSVRSNIFQANNVKEFISPNLGLSSGEITTLTFDYKAAAWAANTVGAPATDFTIDVEWSTDAAGPWINLGQINDLNHVMSGDCAPAPGTYQFTPDAGDNVFVRFVVTRFGGDNFYNIDNVSVQEFLPPCTGMPDPGATASTSPDVCAGVNFTLSLANLIIPGGDVDYVWQTSVNGIDWIDALGAPNASTWTTSQNEATFYRCAVICNNSSQTAQSTALEVSMSSFISCYCTMTSPTQTFDSEILSVSLNGEGTSNIDNQTPCPAVAGVGDFTVQTVTLMEGVTYDLNVLMGQCGSFAYTNTLKAWIDFNQDGLWDDATENLGFLTQEAPPAGVNGMLTFTVPFGASIGSTGMRVMMMETTNPAMVLPCAVFAYGSVHDYTVNIVANTNCQGVPTPGNTLSSVPSVCPQTNFNLSLENGTPGSAVTYQWQTSEDGVTWTNALGSPNTATWSTNQMMPTWYRCIVTCTASDEFAESIGVLVDIENFMNCYCTNVGPTSATFSELFNVNLNSGLDMIDNATPCPAVTGLQNFTAQNITLSRGEEYDLNFIIGQCGSTGSYTNTLKAWIDYNHSGAFTAPEEELGVFTALAPPAGVSGSVTFTVPLDAELGQTVLRVVTNETGIVTNVNPCGTFTWGSAHDYTVTILEAPTCPMPSGLTISNITDSGADATWTPGGDEENWEVHYGEAGFTPGQGTTASTTAPEYTFSGLLDNTEYEFYVRAICGAGDTSFWKGPQGFKTVCNTFVAPYIENFDGSEWATGTGFNNAGATISDCWSNDPSASPSFFWGTRTGLTGNSTTSGPASDKSGNGNYIYTEASNGAINAGLVATFDSPRIDLSEIADPYLGFSYFMRGANVDSLNVYVSNDNGDSWNDLAVIVGQQQFQLTDQWKDTIISLAAYENEIVMIRFQNIKNTSFNDDVAIDDFFVLPCVGNPGTGSSNDVCILDGNVSLPDLATINQVGGTWLFPQNPIYVVNNETFNYSVLPYGTYNVYYKVPGACADDSLTVTITVAPPSSAGQSAAFSNCNNGFINLFDGITGLVDLTGTWYTPSNQPLNSALVNVNGQLPGIYNYYYIASNGICPADTSFAEVTLSDCASIEENSLAGFELYPNPTENHVFITYKGEAISAEVYVNDAKGSVIFTQSRAFETNSTLEIDLSNVQSGAYIVTVMSEGRRTTMQLIKQ